MAEQLSAGYEPWWRPGGRERISCCSAFETYTENHNHTDALEGFKTEGNIQLLKAKCQSWRTSLEARKEALTSWSERVKKAENHAQVLRTRVEELQRRFTSQLRWVCYAKDRALRGREWAPAHEMGHQSWCPKIMNPYFPLGNKGWKQERPCLPSLPVTNLGKISLLLSTSVGSVNLKHSHGGNSLIWEKPRILLNYKLWLPSGYFGLLVTRNSREIEDSPSWQDWLILIIKQDRTTVTRWEREGSHWEDPMGNLFKYTPFSICYRSLL